MRLRAKAHDKYSTAPAALHGIGERSDPCPGLKFGQRTAAVA